MFLVGPDTWGAQIDEYHTPNPETKGLCGDGVRCDGTPEALSVGQPGYFAPPPPLASKINKCESGNGEAGNRRAKKFDEVISLLAFSRLSSQTLGLKNVFSKIYI